MTCKHIASRNNIIRLITQKEHELEKMVQYIPDARIINHSEVYHFTLRFTKDKPKLVTKPDEIIISSEEENPKDIVTASSRILEHLLFLNGQYSVHSSAFSINDSVGILLPGQARTGKTMTMIDMCKNGCYKVISSDRTVIENDSMIAGTKVINTSDKIYSANQSLQVQMLPATLVEIIYPLISNVDATIKELNPTEAFTRLVNQSFYFLEEFPRVIFATTQLFPNITPEVYKNNMLLKMKKLSETVPSISIAGRSEDIKDYITKRCQKYE